MIRFIQVAIVLEPCPCCGKPAKMMSEDGSWGYYPAKYRAQCSSCGLMTPWINDPEIITPKGMPTSRDLVIEQVAAIWNKRQI